jgi:phosphate transport system substrate-binding protein
MPRIIPLLSIFLGLTAAQAAEPIRSAGCKTEYHLIKAIAEAAAPAITLEMGKTGNKKAMQLLAAGQLDLAFTCQTGAKLAGSLDPAQVSDLVTVAIARDPLVLVAHPSAKVSNLTLAQVKDIAAGKITNWSTVGGADLPIKTAWFDASVDSGVVTVFQELTTGEAPLAKPTRALTSPEALGAFSSTETGAVVVLNLNIVKPAFGTVLSIDGKAPDRAAVQTGTYPLSVTYHLVHFRRDSAKVQPFLDFVASSAGLAVIDRVMVSVPR